MEIVLILGPIDVARLEEWLRRAEMTKKAIA